MKSSDHVGRTYLLPEMIRSRELPWDQIRFRAYCDAFWNAKRKQQGLPKAVPANS
jgi:hypothetical protein